ncbi:MAG TPA: dinitrogenase iron-molybdenum cofactor biosynthesis protein [Chloroflexi bacterium]|nr:dinitrogenase iron-molybdenum cofactor biosynthesis protein [Chloroflexota bacterium]
MGVKIAFATEDGERLTNHFGHAPYYQVFTIENGRVTAVEQRLKGHHSDDEEEHGHHSDSDHAAMFASIQDCQTLVAGSMGRNAYRIAQSTGLDVVLTAGNIQSALQAYLDGTLKHNPRRVHAPGLHRH